MHKRRQFNENESRLFWQISSELNHLLQDDPTSRELDYLVEEVDTMLQATESETIRRRCRELLSKIKRPVTGTAG